MRASSRTAHTHSHTLQNLRRELLRVLTTRHMVQPQAARGGPDSGWQTAGTCGTARHASMHEGTRLVSCVAQRRAWLYVQLVSQYHASVIRCVLQKSDVLQPAATTTVTTLSSPASPRAGRPEHRCGRGTPPPRPRVWEKKRNEKSC